MSSALVHARQFVVSDLLGSVVRFPAWWYTEGLMRLLRSIHNGLSYRARRYGFSVWWRNLFVPMYGLGDVWSRIISFVMRVVILCFRGVLFAVESAADVLLVFAYILLPAVAAFMVVRGPVMWAFLFIP